MWNGSVKLFQETKTSTHLDWGTASDTSLLDARSPRLELSLLLLLLCALLWALLLLLHGLSLAAGLLLLLDLLLTPSFAPSLSLLSSSRLLCLATLLGGLCP
jgi:hypothetical protein